MCCFICKNFWLQYLCLRLTRELEKKFSDRHVVFVAQRRMLRKPTRTSRVKQKRPRSRTLTNVHEKVLEDLVFPGGDHRQAGHGSRSKAQKPLKCTSYLCFCMH